MTIVKKEIIASGPIVALTLERRGKGKMHSYHPGQYITLRLKKDGYFHNRHYSLIQPFDGKTYRIAIRGEIDHEPQGVVSTEIIRNYKLGDLILASFPADTFSLIENAKHYLFITGGIGITVLSSMILELHKQEKSNYTRLVHYVSTAKHAAFADQLKQILSKDQYQLFCENEKFGKDELEKVLTADTHVYICGSTSFMREIEDYLAQCKHRKSHIYVKVFQPSLSVIKSVVNDTASTKTL